VLSRLATVNTYSLLNTISCIFEIIQHILYILLLRMQTLNESKAKMHVKMKLCRHIILIK